MLNGDISDQVEPTILVVFEGLVASPPKSRLVISGGRRAGKFRRLAWKWEFDATVAAALWRMWSNGNRNIELVTFLGEEFRAAMQDRLEWLNYPYRRFWSCESPDVLARQLVSMPHIIAVYHGDAARPFLYGNAGRVVTGELRTEIGRF